MVELKFNALKPNGQTISGTLSADTFQLGKKKILALLSKNNFKLKNIQKKSTFVYKIRKGSEPIVKGEQRAFTKEEVVNALTRLGYQVVSVNKYAFEWNPAPPQQEVLSFVKISAEPFIESLNDL